MTTRRDALKRIGGRCFDVALGVFLIAVLVLIWNSSRTKANSGHGAEGATAKAAKANRAGVNGIMSLQGSACNICIKDDSNGNQICFDTGGNYTFTDCNGFVQDGVGVYTQKGGLITLRDFRPDHRLDLTFDSSVRRAKMGYQNFQPQRIFTITDRNTTDDVCDCGGIQAEKTKR